MRLRLGISTCPNDTFAFHGILSGAVVLPGLDLDLELMDIQELNERLQAGTLDVAKVSFHAALKCAADHVVLPVGAALGYGVGPLLLARAPGLRPTAASSILCPGEDTTATLLVRCFHPEVKKLKQVRFDHIMPALRRGEAEFGAVIHEGRFTFAQAGLHCLQDLGEQWHQRTGAPLPLGGLVARADLDRAVLSRVTVAVRESLRMGRENRTATLPTMPRLAQELDDEVIFQPADLYVNESTLDLGSEGRSALEALHSLVTRSGALPANSPPLTVL